MKGNFFTLRTVMWDRGKVKMIDQTLLPARLVYRSYARWEDVADAIRRLVVRGAPAIGVAAAMAIAATAWGSKAKTADALRKELEGAAA
ncbi:MAG: S-methyl-5-thioribose-1-phosphate isomerase, partial [Nitrososphaerota archaeon]|nr:S-methyl-5-thioribose-1-phosphate isomerase [Nitrososphaerota archaeon]